MTDCIAESKDYADLFADNPKAAAVFLMMLPQPDPYGILSADPDVFKGCVCPKLRIRDVAVLLEAMERHRLIERYCDSDDRPLLWVRKYHKHQTVNWERTGPPEHELPIYWTIPDELIAAVTRPPEKGGRRGASPKLRQWYEHYAATRQQSLTVSDSHRPSSTGYTTEVDVDVDLDSDVDSDSERRNTLAPPASAEAALLEVEPKKTDKPRRKETEEQLAIRETFEQLTGIDWPGGTPKGYTGLHAEVVNRGYDILRTWAVSGDETTKPGTAKNLVGWYFTRAAEAMRRDWKYIAKNGNTPSAEHQSWQGWPSRFEVECLTGVFTDEEVSEAARSPDYWNFPTHNINGSEQQRLEKAHRKYEREKASAEAEA